MNLNLNPKAKGRREGNPKVSQQRAKRNDYMNEKTGPTSYFFDLGLGPTSATIVFMD